MGELAALTTALCWSWTAIFFTLSSRRVGSVTINFLRLPMGSLFLLITCLCFGGRFSLNANQLVLLSLSGVIGLAVGDGFLFESFVLIGPRNAMLVYTTSPAITAFLAYYILGEELRPRSLIGMVVTLAGVVWVLMEKENGRSRFNLRGVLFALFGAAGQSIGLILAKPVLLGGVDPLFATFIRMIAATLCMTLLVKWLPLGDFKGLLAERCRPLLFLLAGVLVGPFLGVWLSQIAIKLTHTGVAATLFSTIPVILIPITYFVEGERASLRSCLGAVIAVVGVALLFL